MYFIQTRFPRSKKKRIRKKWRKKYCAYPLMRFARTSGKTTFPILVGVDHAAPDSEGSVFSDLAAVLKKSKGLGNFSNMYLHLPSNDHAQNAERLMSGAATRLGKELLEMKIEMPKFNLSKTWCGFDPDNQADATILTCLQQPLSKREEGTNAAAKL